MQTETITYYKLEKVEIKPPAEGEFRITTAALRWCDLCGVTIDSMGGPGDGSICIKCGDAVRHGQLRGQLVWEEESEPTDR